MTDRKAHRRGTLHRLLSKRDRVGPTRPSATSNSGICWFELRCAEDDCPDVETVIAVFGEPGKARKHKLLKPVTEVSRSDVRTLAARGTHG